MGLAAFTTGDGQLAAVNWIKKKLHGAKTKQQGTGRNETTRTSPDKDPPTEDTDHHELDATRDGRTIRVSSRPAVPPPLDPNAGWLARFALGARTAAMHFQSQRDQKDQLCPTESIRFSRPGPLGQNGSQHSQRQQRSLKSALEAAGGSKYLRDRLDYRSLTGPAVYICGSVLNFARKGRRKANQPKNKQNGSSFSSKGLKIRNLRCVRCIALHHNRSDIGNRIVAAPAHEQREDCEDCDTLSCWANAHRSLSTDGG